MTIGKFRGKGLFSSKYKFAKLTQEVEEHEFTNNCKSYLKNGRWFYS